MREIKFRAWDKDNKEWCDDFCIELSTGRLLCDHGTTLYVQEIILEQYTGLKDSTGKEMYEGDIVEWFARMDMGDNRPPKQGTIIWDDVEAQFNVDKFCDNSQDCPCCAFSEGASFTVIGHIHKENQNDPS